MVSLNQSKFRFTKNLTISKIFYKIINYLIIFTEIIQTNIYEI